MSLEDHERGDLAGALLESIEPTPDRDVEAAWAQEIERRVRQIDGAEVELIPWSDVRQRLHALLDARAAD